MRLDKFVANTSGLSRKQARCRIRSGEVQVNQQIVTDGQTHIDTHSEIALSGRRLRPRGHRYLMLHKPAGVICANRDAHHMTAIDLIGEESTDALQIVGRLDKDTTGLVLLTDDGPWNHRLSSPRRQCPKVYQVHTLRPIEASVIDHFAEGVVLPPDDRLTLPAQLAIEPGADRRYAQLVLHEGRYHQVKRMFEAVGNRVLSLHRSAIGPIELDAELTPGCYRSLTPGELASLN